MLSLLTVEKSTAKGDSMKNIFNPNPFEIAIEAAHTAAIVEDAKRETAKETK